MKTRNMITSLVLIAVLMLSAFSVFAGASFSDVKSTDWFYSYVMKAAEKNIVSGYPDGTFRPKNKVTYAEFVVMAMRGEKSSNTRGLKDWYAPYYYAAVDNGIFSEGEIAYAAMSKPIPRGDMAVIMAGVLAYNDLASVKTVNASDTFSDIAITSRYEYPVSLCNYYGALSGYPDGTFRPNGTLTRAEAATAMVAMVETIEKYVVPTDPQQPPVPQDPEKAWPEPTDRASLLQYMDNFRTGVDVWYKNGKTYGPSSNVDVPAFENTENTSKLGKNALKFADPDILAYAQQLCDSVKFTKNGDAVTIDYAWPNLPSYITKVGLQLYVVNSNARDGVVKNESHMANAYSGSQVCSSVKWSSATEAKVIVKVSGIKGNHSEAYTLTYTYDKATKKTTATYAISGDLVNNSSAIYKAHGTSSDVPSTVFSGLK